MRLVFVALLATALLATPVFATARARVRTCDGHITDSRGAPIGVGIRRGDASCRTAKRVLRAYLNSSRPCEGSACVRRHSGWTCVSEKWTERPRVANCRRGRGLISAYEIADRAM